MSADTEKPPSIQQAKPAPSTLTIKTTPVAAVQAPPAAEAVASTTPAPTQAVDTSTYPTDEDSDKLWIYNHESGNDPTKVNAIGCRGIGQACPGDKLPCGDDYACQDAWFTQYMLDRYGSWVNAKTFWIANNWW